MELARRGRPATVGAGVDDDDDGRRSPDPMLPHGDSMLVIRGDALLSQLQKDRLRQEIILAELVGKIKCALAKLGALNNQVSQGRGSVWVCRFCRSNCTCKSDLENHMNGKRHQRNIRALLEECKSMESNYASPQVKSDPNNAPQDEEGTAATWTCSLCQARCTRRSELENHLRGKRHRLNFRLLLQEAAAKQYLSQWGCGICPAKCNSASQFDHHCKGKVHQRKIKALHEDMGIQRALLYFCKLCNLQCNSKNTLVEHCKGKRHSDKLMSLSFCEVCDLQCNSEKMLAHHRTGKKHLAKLKGR